MKLKKEQRFFRVYPSVVKAGKKTKIEIFSVFEKMKFKKEEYTIRIVPMEKRDFPRNDEFRIEKNIFDEIKVKPVNNKIEFEYEFHGEQEYRILFPNENNKELYAETFDYSFSVYSLYEDLYELNPYKGDLHIHSTASDGKGEPYEVAARYREEGFDFICLTDHHKYYSSKGLKELYEKTDCGLTVFCGEEVHNCDMGYFHIVNFNGKYSVNTVLEEDYENLKNRLFEEAKELDLPDGIDKREFAFRKWISDEIRKSGGKVIFPHPNWVYRNEYHTETQMTFYSIKEGLYDIFEVLGGSLGRENNLQVSIYNELRAQGYDIPVVGSTDAHDIYEETSAFNHLCTIAFAKTASEIPDKIAEGFSVAVESEPNEAKRVFGKFRLIKYAHFLLERFFPVYREYTKDMGSFMRLYAEEKICDDAMTILNKRAEEYRNRFFGR